MELHGVILTAQYRPTKRDPNKQTFVFSVAPDDGSKHEDIYTNKDELQVQVRNLLNKHVVIDYTQDGKFKNINSLKESEAPKQESRLATNETKPIENDRDARIETQVAVKAVIELIVSGNLKFAEDPLAYDVYCWLRARIPYGAPQTAKKAPIQAPEGMFASDSTPRINKAQLANLRKYVKAKNDGELLAEACYRCNADLKNLEEIPEDIAMAWLNEVVKK